MVEEQAAGCSWQATLSSGQYTHELCLASAQIEKTVSPGRNLEILSHMNEEGVLPSAEALVEPWLGLGLVDRLPALTT